MQDRARDRSSRNTWKAIHQQNQSVRCWSNILELCTRQSRESISCAKDCGCKEWETMTKKLLPYCVNPLVFTERELGTLHINRMTSKISYPHFFSSDRNNMQNLEVLVNSAWKGIIDGNYLHNNYYSQIPSLDFHQKTSYKGRITYIKCHRWVYDLCTNYMQRASRVERDKESIRT